MIWSRRHRSYGEAGFQLALGSAKLAGRPARVSSTGSGLRAIASMLPVCGRSSPGNGRRCARCPTTWTAVRRVWAGRAAGGSSGGSGRYSRCRRPVCPTAAWENSMGEHVAVAGDHPIRGSDGDAHPRFPSQGGGWAVRASRCQPRSARRRSRAGGALIDRVFRKPGGKSGSPGDADGVEIKAAEMKVDGVAESLAVAEPAR